GTDGLVMRAEIFDADREAEALARFDSLAATVPADGGRPPARPRVRTNPATGLVAGVEAAFPARDADAFAAPLADDLKGMHHPLGIEFDRKGALDSFRLLLSARDPMLRFEPLATLGGTLALGHESISASGGAATSVLDFSSAGAIETNYICVFEV